MALNGAKPAPTASDKSIGPLGIYHDLSIPHFPLCPEHCWEPIHPTSMFIKAVWFLVLQEARSSHAMEDSSKHAVMLQTKVRKFQFCSCKLIRHPNIAKLATLDRSHTIPHNGFLQA
jgi:hypothetical protein